MDELATAETFLSLQGEGLNIGVRAAFIRLMGCNLACGGRTPDGQSWVCDTAYTWRPDVKLRTRWTSVPELVTWCDAVNPQGLVVITGGEPLLQADGVAALARELLARAHPVEIETAGTFPPLDVPHLHYNVSPKLSNSGNPRDLRYRPDVLEQFVKSEHWTCIFKFVVSVPSDLAEIEQDFGFIPAGLWGVMPACHTAEEQQQALSWLWPLCREKGIRLFPRLQVMAFGARRGI